MYFHMNRLRVLVKSEILYKQLHNGENSRRLIGLKSYSP